MEDDPIVTAFELLLEIKIGDVQHLTAQSTLNSLLRTTDFDLFSLTQLNDFKDFLDTLLGYCHQNGLHLNLTKFEQQTLKNEAELVKFSRQGWDKTPNLEAFFETVLTVVYLFNLRVQEEVLFDSEIHERIERNLQKLRANYDISKRLRVKEKRFDRYKKLKEFELKSMKTELKESSEKLDRLRRETKEKERTITGLRKDHAKALQENKSLTKLLFESEETRIKHKESLQAAMRGLRQHESRSKQLVDRCQKLHQKNRHLEGVVTRGKKRDSENQKMRFALEEAEDRVRALNKELGRQKQLRETEREKLSEEKQAIASQCRKYKLRASDLDFKFEKMKNGMDYYRNSYRGLLSRHIKETSQKHYDSQPTAKGHDQFGGTEDAANLYSSAIPLDKSHADQQFNFSFDKPTEKKKTEGNPFKKEEDFLSDDEPKRAPNAFYQNRAHDTKSAEYVEIKDEFQAAQDSFGAPDKPREAEEPSGQRGEEDMNWGIDKEDNFLNLSGSFDMHQSFSEKLEDIIEESNESECQSGYSSSRKVELTPDSLFGAAEQKKHRHPVFGGNRREHQLQAGARPA